MQLLPQKFRSGDLEGEPAFRIWELHIRPNQLNPPALKLRGGCHGLTGSRLQQVWPTCRMAWRIEGLGNRRWRQVGKHRCSPPKRAPTPPAAVLPPCELCGSSSTTQDVARARASSCALPTRLELVRPSALLALRRRMRMPASDDLGGQDQVAVRRLALVLRPSIERLAVLMIKWLPLRGTPRRGTHSPWYCKASATVTPARQGRWSSSRRPLGTGAYRRWRCLACDSLAFPLLVQAEAVQHVLVEVVGRLHVRFFKEMRETAPAKSPLG